ncbi:uncharacterized protein M421DRAFT_425555 [Didymella exigua CBS 183.55]|uniref:DRBM domain-containing protein n=1 Tax=Didymella exigua CBS 183.55 TaxID=1150837 RepID=A0A6A5R7P9_9PLEO|nr:uncharacterized protein M421DRAFT_425555 [Didymella exigua CBS 183.55]KAF1923663.1 hypothetical protein M421DRAFT_425555 [Didymella exigua CBS 183.55]
MPAAGDDLRKYLIVPPASSSSSSSSHLNQLASTQLAPDSRPDTPRLHKLANRKTESINMEVGHGAHPSTVSSAHIGYDAVTEPVGGVMTIDDFLSANQEDHDAFMAAREKANALPTKKSKTKSSTPVQPVAVGTRSSEHTVRLHDLYQKLAIPQPVFMYEGDSITKFTVEISFPGLANAEELQGLKEEGRFNSKQEAKEASSKSALAILERLVEEGRVTNAGKTKKPKGESAQQLPKEKEEPGENFVGQLLEFQRAAGAPQPTYKDYQLGTRWACLAEIEGHDQPFSSLDALFGSKKAARQHAAGCAVAHFKSAGIWPAEFTDVGGIKKRKAAALSPSLSSPNSGKASVASTSTAGVASATAQVTSLAHMLNLSTPEYRFTYPDPSVADIHTVSCYFKNGGAHEGPIGEVRNIFGKKNAKNECARNTLAYLTEVKRQREEIANRLIADIKGGAGVASMGVGMAMDGEEGAKQRMGKKQGSDDDLDIYEDAMEY